ncbi:MAG: hypothetical protein ACRCV0_02260 [Brevinema sp.]
MDISHGYNLLLFTYAYKFYAKNAVELIIRGGLGPVIAYPELNIDGIYNGTSERAGFMVAGIGGEIALQLSVPLFDYLSIMFEIKYTAAYARIPYSGINQENGDPYTGEFHIPHHAIQTGALDLISIMQSTIKKIIVKQHDEPQKHRLELFKKNVLLVIYLNKEDFMKNTIKILLLILCLGACTITEVEKAQEWIAKLTKRPMYDENTHEPLIIDSVNGNIKIIYGTTSTNTNYYRFDSARSDKEAYYTRYSGSYVGILICDTGKYTNELGLYEGKVQIVDAITKPSQSKRNIIFEPSARIAVFQLPTP